MKMRPKRPTGRRGGGSGPRQRPFDRRLQRLAGVGLDALHGALAGCGIGVVEAERLAFERRDQIDQPDAVACDPYLQRQPELPSQSRKCTIF